MTRRAAAPLGNRAVFRWPLVMAMANAAGLVAALVGDGWYDVLSWFALGATVVVMIACWRGGRR